MQERFTQVSSLHLQEDDMVHSEKMAKSLMILERMVNQNAEDEIFQDFKVSVVAPLV